MDEKRKSNNPSGRPENPNSIRSRLKSLGIPKRSYYNVKEEMGEDATFDEIVEACEYRKQFAKRKKT